MRHSWNNKDIKLGVHSLAHSILNSITLIQAGFGLSNWWVASLLSPDFLNVWFLLFLSNRNSLLLAQCSWATVVWYFVFCRPVLVVLPWICERHSAPPQNIIKSTANVFLHCDSAVVNSTDSEVSGQWNLGGTLKSILACMHTPIPRQSIFVRWK